MEVLDGNVVVARRIGRGSERKVVGGEETGEERCQMMKGKEEESLRADSTEGTKSLLKRAKESKISVDLCDGD